MPKTVWIPGIGNTVVPDDANDLPAGSKPVPAPAMSTTTATPGMPSSAVAAPKYTNAMNAAIPTSNIPAPKLGYGGADFNQSDAATQQSIIDNQNRLASDPGFVTSELARTQDVIKNRQSEGLDITDQTNYLTKLQGMVPKQQPVQTQSAPTTQTTSAPPQSIPQSNVPPQQSGSIYTPLSTKEIQDEAKSRIDKMFGGLKQAVDYAKTGLRNNFDYANQVTNARRVMEDQQLSRSVSPFSGRLNYLQQGLAFDRGLQDTAANKDFNAAMAAQDQKLADFQAMAPEQQQALYDQLLRAERDFGLQKGTLTGDIGGTPTLAKTAQDAQYTGMYGGQMSLPAQMQYAQMYGENPFTGQSTLAGKQANLDAALQVGQQRGQVLAPTQTWGDLFTQQGAPNYQAIRDSIKDQQYQQQFDENTKQWGLDYALRKALQDNQLANQVADNALQKQRLDWEMSPDNPNNAYKLRDMQTADPKELQGLYTGLTSGQIDPASALDEIDMQTKAGMYTPVQAAQMKALVQTYVNNKPMAPMAAPTQDQIKANGGTNPQDFNQNQLEKLWNTDPTGKSAGRPLIDWSQWYRDPNGRLGGISYENWHKAYGPQLKAK